MDACYSVNCYRWSRVLDRVKDATSLIHRGGLRCDGAWAGGGGGGVAEAEISGSDLLSSS